MKNEKIAIAVLVVIVVAALSAFLIISYGDVILQNIFQQKPVIAEGDCADIHYIGRYVDNSTIFDSSYNDTTNRTGGEPLKVFITLNKTAEPPEGYETYSSGLIDSFMEGLYGLEEGQTKTIGPIPPQDAYGIKLDNGDMFSTDKIAFEINVTVEVQNRTEDNISVYWIYPETLGNFTMPQILIKDLSKIYDDENAAVTVPPPMSIWKNETRVVNVTPETFTVKVTPTSSTHLVNTLTMFYYRNISTYGFLFPDATTATWNDTTITINNSPVLGATYVYNYVDYYGVPRNTTFTVEHLTSSVVNLSRPLDSVNKSYTEITRTFSFNTTYTIHRLYAHIPLQIFSMIYAEDVQNAGFSLHQLAGETLLFEVTVEKIYKTG